jgi:hypothetical protein
MFDFAMRLRENAHLPSLLSHYARLGSEDRTVWQDRLMQMDGVEPQHLTLLHGELIAFDWIEQNTAGASLRSDGTLAACYRITRHGLQEFRRLSGVEAVEESPEPPEQLQPRFARKKKAKAESSGVVASE